MKHYQLNIHLFIICFFFQTVPDKATCVVIKNTYIHNKQIKQTSPEYTNDLIHLITIERCLFKFFLSFLFHCGEKCPIVLFK